MLIDKFYLAARNSIKSPPRIDRDFSPAILKDVLRTGRNGWRRTVSALPFFALLLFLTIALPIALALAQEESPHDYLTVKYDNAGSELWRQANDSGNWNFAYGVAVDLRDNSVIVTGSSDIWHDYNANMTIDEGEVSKDYYTIKYDSTGKKLWEATYDHFGRDEAFAVAVDSAGNIIVAGRSDDDFCTIKYDPEGNELWDEPVIYDGGYEDVANDVTVDRDNNIIVTGSSEIWHDYNANTTVEEDEVNNDFCTLKYDPNGEQLWDEPAVYDGMTCFLDVNGYLLHRATGEMVFEWSCASAFGLDLKKKDWLRAIISYIGVDMEKFPPLVRSVEFTLIITLAQLPGYAVAAWLIEVWGRRTTLAVFLAGSAVAATLFGTATTDTTVLLFGCLLSFFNLGAWGALYAITPELFPTRVRSTGTGVTFNSGRVLAAVSVLGAGGLMLAFGGDYARVGSFTALIYAVGMLVICFAPDTTRQRMED